MTSPTHPSPEHDACDVATLDALGAQHERFEQVLESLHDLIDRLRTGRPDERARAAAAQVVATLDGEVPPHRAAEERLVLPALRRAGGEAGVALAARLEAEHDLIARAWSQCRPALAELAGSGHWAMESAAFEFERWRDLSALVTAHLLAEQGAAFPTVRAWVEGSTPGR